MMDITRLARFSGGYAFTRTKNAETGKATSFDKECGKEDVDSEKKENPNVRDKGLIYTIFEENDDGSYIAEFYYDGSTPYDSSDMTEDGFSTQELTGGVPTVRIPPKVANRMGNDRAYAKRVLSQIEQYIESQGGQLKNAKLPLDKDGNITNQDSPDNLYVRMTRADNNGRNIREARAERQEEYIKYCQQKEMEHRIALSVAASGEIDNATEMLLGLL